MSIEKIVLIVLIGLVACLATVGVVDKCIVKFDPTEVPEVPKASCNIALGEYAGFHWTDESLHFAFTLPSAFITRQYVEYSTSMTPNEYDVILRVVKRAIENPWYWDIPNEVK